MIVDGLQVFAGRRVLLLQGPIGPFFGHLSRDLMEVGASPHRIVFNGGDWLFARRGAGKVTSYRGSFEEWRTFLQAYLADNGIDLILLFGDCRRYHRVAHRLAEEMGIEVGVFEEGYLRPDHVTLERFGVNGHSRLPRSPFFYRNLPAIDTGDQRRVGDAFWHAMVWAILYYLAANLLRFRYAQYQHHRPLALIEGALWWRSGFRKAWYRWRESGMESMLAGRYAGKFFLVPLQVHNDAQVQIHSGFSDMPSFMRFVVKSFARHAPADTHLVFKHHPMDRGYITYTKQVDELRAEFGLQGRLHYIHDQHLPTLLRAAAGVVVINSTVGISALHHGAPVKSVGEAIYNFPGLTYQKSLDRFWRDAEKLEVDADLYRSFRTYLLGATQLNGNFYRRLAGAGTHSGLIWQTRDTNRLTKYVREMPLRPAGAPEIAPVAEEPVLPLPTPSMTRQQPGSLLH